MEIKRILFIALIAVAALSGCNFDYLEEALNSYDEDTSDLVIEWNADETIRTAYDSETNEVVWYETWEYDEDDSNLLCVQRFTPEDVLKWSTLYKYANGLKVQEVCYSSADELLWYSVFVYNDSSLLEAECNYDETSTLQWFDVYGYTGDLLVSRARYNSGSVMTNGYFWEYDGSDRKIKETHYSGITSRNSAGLTYPEAGDTPDFPPFSTDGQTLADWTMWSYDTNGYFSMQFDADNYPIEMYREDDRMTRALTVEIDYYANHVPKSKVTSYGSDTVLDVQLTYNSSGYLSVVDTTGEGLLIPLRYEIDYNSDLSIDKLSIYQSDTILFYFTYDSSISTDQSVHPLDPIGFTGTDYTITQHDGDGAKLGSYEVTTDLDAGEVMVQAYTAAGAANGYYLSKLDASGNVATFECWSAAGVRQWYYSYDYTAIAGEIMRTAEEQWDAINDVVEDYTSIDPTTLIMDMLFN